MLDKLFVIINPLHMAQKKLTFSLSPTIRAYVNSTAIVNVIVSGAGEGKCLRPDTDILLADGTMKQAHEVRTGDELMGDDSAPRKVLSVTSGEDQMFRIVPVKGEPFEVNGPHILVLKRTPSKRGQEHKIVLITVTEYLLQSRKFRHNHKLYRVPVEFPEKPLPLPPYFLGLWLADGTSSLPQVTTPDPEVVAYLKKLAQDCSLNFVDVENHEKFGTYKLSADNGERNPVLAALRDLGLVKNKHIPHRYKANSRRNRLELLAGLIDGDGWTNNGGYQLIFKSQDLAEDAAYLCRSLGFAAYVKPRTKNGFGIEGTYHHVMVSGDCSVIPVRVARKKVPPRKQIKDPLVTGIKEIIPLGKGPYCGFTLDGNHRFLLGDFTVTHNTYGSTVAMVRHAQRCGRPIRCAIVRDTHENIKNATIRSIMEVFEDFPHLLKFRNDFKQLTIFSSPRVEADLFGIDDLASLSKLQGPEYALIWLEEPAPMADRQNAGLSEEVYNAALVRCARQKGTVPRLQVSMNPADEDHWTHRRLILEPEIHPDYPLITKRVFFVPPGENKHLKEVTRQAVMAAYKDDPASYRRYVEGKFAPVHRGERVTPEFNPNIHVAPVPLEPAPGLVSFRVFDGWHNPCCLMGQITATGRLIFIDMVRLTGGDIRSLLQAQLLPLLNSPRWKDKARSWRDGGDFTMRQPDQSNKQESAARVIEEVLGTNFEAGPHRWPILEGGMKRALNMMIGGLPAIVINPELKALQRSLEGAWHYKTDPSGNRIGDRPVKDRASDVGDCFANATSILLPTRGEAVDKLYYRRQAQKTRQRAASYA